MRCRQKPETVLRLGRRRRWQIPIAASIAVLLVVTTVVCWSLRDASGPPEPSAASPETTAGSPPSRPTTHHRVAPPAPDERNERPGLGFEPGDFLRYRFFQNREITLAAMQALGSEQEVAEHNTVAVSLQTVGVLSVTVYDQSASGWTVGFQVSEVESEVGSSEAAETRQDEDLQEEMAGEVAAFMEFSGKILKLVFHPSVSPRGRNYWKALLAHWQIVLPEDERQNEWSVAEEDTTGTYLALYRRDVRDGGTVVTKSKEGYTSVRTGSDAQEDLDFADMTAARGRVSIVLDPRPVSIDGEEWFEVEPTGMARTVDSHVSFRFLREARERREYAEALSKVRDLESARGTTLKADEIPEGAPLATESDQPDVAALLRDIEQTIATLGVDTPQAIEYMTQLVSAMTRDPAVVDAVMAKLGEESCVDDMVALLMGALGAAGTEAAQAGLEGIITGEEWPIARKDTALFAFAQVKMPRAEMDVVLQDIYEEKGPLCNTALLLLGSVGDRVRESQPGRFELIEDYLTSLCGQTYLGQGERAAILEAMGNLGPSQTPREVQEAFGDLSERIRVAAIRALRRTPDALAGELLLNAFLAGSEKIRGTAARTLAEYPRAASEELLRQVMPGEPSSTVRRSFLVGLSRRQRLDQETRELVDWLARNDSSEDIRRYARNLLQ